MKIKNIIILGGIVFAIYYLSKKKNGLVQSNLVPKGSDAEGGDSIPDNGDINLENVMNGDKPQSEAEADVLRLFKQATQSYRGGARPTIQVLGLIESGKREALAKIQAQGLAEKFKEWHKKFGQKKKSKYPVPMDRIDAIQIRRKKMPLPRNRTNVIGATLRSYRNSLGLANEPLMAV